MAFSAWLRERDLTPRQREEASAGAGRMAAPRGMRLTSAHHLNYRGRTCRQGMSAEGE